MRAADAIGEVGAVRESGRCVASIESRARAHFLQESCYTLALDLTQGASMFRFLTWFGFLSIVIACSSTPGVKRVWIDSSSHTDDPPSWVEGLKIIWEKDAKVYIRSTQTIRGDERVNGCYDLAKLDAKEAILTELASEVRGSLDNAQQSINENAEVVLGKVRSGEFQGRITGLRHSEQYFERYKVGDVERIDCHVLSEMTREDYDKVKRSVLDRLQKVDARLREAITKKQINFFDKSPEAVVEPKEASQD
jgi:hypothetical protein